MLIYPLSPEINFRYVNKSKYGVPQGPVLKSPYFGEKKCKILIAIISHTPPDPGWWLVPRFTRDAIYQWSKETHVGISTVFQKRRLKFCDFFLFFPEKSIFVLILIPMYNAVNSINLLIIHLSDTVPQQINHKMTHGVPQGCIIMTPTTLPLWS